VIFAICIADWVKYARTIRGSVLEIKDNAYVVAARSSGAGDFRILLRHILPNALPPIFVVMAVDLAVVIMLEATLSFLGVGVPLTEPSIGMMIAIGKNYIYAGMWWLTLFPGATLIFWWWPSTFFPTGCGMSSTPSWPAVQYVHEFNRIQQRRRRVEDPQ
jgi:peptide/nickel transport system permease protein